MDDNTLVLIGAWVGCSLVAGMTLFFSFHPKLFIRVFVPRDEWKEMVRVWLRGPDTARAMRQCAAMQFALGQLFGAVAIARLIAG